MRPCFIFCRLTWSSTVLALSTISAFAQTLAVDGVSIGQRVTNLSTQGYACSPSDDFPGLTRCQRSRTKGPGGTQSEQSSVLHAADGTAYYVMNLLAPAQLSKSQIDGDIADLSRRIGRQPTSSDLLPEQAKPPSAILALWGDLRVEELGQKGREAISAGRSAKEGVLIDLVGNFSRSIKEDLPIYRVVGNKGFVYVADFGPGTRGHRRLVTIDADAILIRKFDADIQAILAQDRSLPKEDLSLWPKIAEKGRRLALDTSLQTADIAIERAFQRGGEKYKSTLWPRLPGSVIEGLGAHSYRPGVDHYGTLTKFPQIRSDLQAWISAHPSDRFIDIAHYALGELEQGLQKRPGSAIKDVLHYGIAHREIRLLARDMIDAARKRSSDVPSGFTDSNHRIRYLHRNPKIFDNKPIAPFVPAFDARARLATPHLQAAVGIPTSAIADDAAFFLGFLAYHRGEMDPALASFAQAMTLGNRDYADAAVRQSIRALATMPAEEQIRRVEASPVFTRNIRLSYVAARSAYREFNYAAAIDYLPRALGGMNVPVNAFPATTDPDRMEPELRRLAPQLAKDSYDAMHLLEMLYLYVASQEMQQFVKYAATIPSLSPAAASKRVREVIIKYSYITEDHDKTPKRKTPQLLQHRDLRQALHLIDVALASTPKTQPFTELNEWLHYRKVRVLNAFQRKEDRDGTRARGVEAAVAKMQQEVPGSKLLDDAMAELIVAQGLKLRDPEAAQRTFKTLLERYPDGNAVDNAHGWMAATLYCANRGEEAQAVDREIVRRFPQTRHATYAKERLKPNGRQWADGSFCESEGEEYGSDKEADDVENTPCEFIMTNRENYGCR